MADFTSTLIVAPPGRLRDSLRVMVKAARQTKQVIQADDGRAALAIITRQAPDLVILDAALPDDGAWTFLSDMRQRFPDVACAMLVYNQEEEVRSRAGGATTILPVGFSVDSIAGTFSPAMEFDYPPAEPHHTPDHPTEKPVT